MHVGHKRRSLGLAPSGRSAHCGAAGQRVSLLRLRARLPSTWHVQERYQLLLDVGHPACWHGPVLRRHADGSIVPAAAPGRLRRGPAAAQDAHLLVRRQQQPRVRRRLRGLLARKQRRAAAADLLAVSLRSIHAQRRRLPLRCGVRQACADIDRVRSALDRHGQVQHRRLRRARLKLPRHQRQGGREVLT